MPFHLKLFAQISLLGVRCEPTGELSKATHTIRAAPPAMTLLCLVTRVGTSISSLQRPIHTPAPETAIAATVIGNSHSLFSHTGNQQYPHTAAIPLIAAARIQCVISRGLMKFHRPSLTIRIPMPITAQATSSQRATRTLVYPGGSGGN